MNKWLLLLLALGVLMWLFSAFAGFELLSISTVLLAIFTLLLLQKFGVFRALPIPKRQETIALIIVGVILLFTGGFSFIGLDFSGMITGATITPAAPTSAAVQTCKASIPSENLGKSATVTINAYNKESNTPYSSAVDTQVYIVDDEGNVVKSSDTTAYSLQSYSTGDVISVYGGDSSYYVDPKENICIDKSAFPLDLDVHAAVAASNLQITCYDNTGSATLSSGTNSSQEDYDITIGADGEDSFYCKLKVNVANKAYNLYAVGTLVSNDIDECEPQDSVWTAIDTPKFLDGIGVGAVSSSDADAISDGSYNTWILPEPILMTEWETKKYQFNFAASSTDPATNGDFKSSDMAVVCFLDGIYERGSDGNIYFDFYKHDEAESDVGVDNSEDTPVGKQDCVVIEGI